MSKEFRPGLAYVFSSKKFRKWFRKAYKGCKTSDWHKDINGRKVEFTSNDTGNVNSYAVAPDWCKCIGVEKQNKKRAAESSQ